MLVSGATTMEIVWWCWHIERGEGLRLGMGLWVGVNK